MKERGSKTTLSMMFRHASHVCGRLDCLRVRWLRLHLYSYTHPLYRKRKEGSLKRHLILKRWLVLCVFSEWHHAICLNSPVFHFSGFIPRWTFMRKTDWLKWEVNVMKWNVLSRAQGSGKNSPYWLLKIRARSWASSKCWIWSSPTGTCVDLHNNNIARS